MLTCSWVTPWIAEHELLQAEAPAEMAGLHMRVAAMHSKCMQSQRFMAAVQREAAGMTAREVEQLQVIIIRTIMIIIMENVYLASRH